MRFMIVKMVVICGLWTWIKLLLKWLDSNFFPAFSLSLFGPISCPPCISCTLSPSLCFGPSFCLPLLSPPFSCLSFFFFSLYPTVQAASQLRHPVWYEETLVCTKTTPIFPATQYHCVWSLAISLLCPSFLSFALSSSCHSPSSLLSRS